MRIVQCFFTFETGGAQILALELVNEMCHHHDVSVVIINNRWNKRLLSLLDKRVKVVLINRKEGARNPWPILKFNYALFKINPDIIHCHEPNAVKLIKATRAKVLQTIHDVGIAATNYGLYNMLVAISDAVYKDVKSKCDLAVKKIYNGIPMDLFNRRSDYMLDDSQPLKIVQVSRLMHDKKGQDILLRALHAVVHEYGFSNFSLDFVGGGISYDYLVELASELGLTKFVNFTGEKERNWLFDNLSNYHVLIQPSRYEGFGLTILEGLAAGLPVIASDIDGPAEILVTIPGGFIFENESVESCAKTLIHLINLYKDNKINGLMNESISLVRDKYSINTCMKEYVALYSRLKKDTKAQPVLSLLNGGG
ncbi:MAG: glycosyltransferase family 4 protein [Chitinophagaceae bacterium]